MNDGGFAFPYYDDPYDHEDDEDARFERELQITIEESLKSEKRKRQLAQDEELARKLQLREQQRQQQDGEERVVARPIVAAVTDHSHPTVMHTITAWTCSICTFVNHCSIDPTSDYNGSTMDSSFAAAAAAASGILQPRCEMCGTNGPSYLCETFDSGRRSHDDVTTTIPAAAAPSSSSSSSSSSFNHGDFGYYSCAFDTAASTNNYNNTLTTTSTTTTTTTSAATTNAVDHDDINNNGHSEEQEDYTDLLRLRELQDYWNAKEESMLVASQIWTCVTCHKINQKDVTLCSQCLEPQAASTSRNSSNTPHSQHEPQDLWPCSQCTFDNSYDDKVCFMCGHAIPQRYNHHKLQQQHCGAQHGTGRPSECGMPGCCQRAVHYGFCSKAHMDLAMRKNILPPSEAGVEAVLVGHTGDYTAHLLRTSHPKHASVKKQFLDSWKKTDEGFPRVQRIYWIRMRPEILESFDLMKLQLGNCNVQRMFHGTSQASTCYFGTNPLKVPCLNDANCRVCSIIRNSFDLVHVKRGEGGQAWAHQTQQLRYGEGMYFSPVSSKSNDYNRLSERKQKGKRGEIRKWKCMFLCNVVLGKQHRTKEGFLPKEQCPPEGYDSVWGETGPNLNYEEACVYNANQAIPSYLIVYSLRA